MTRKPNQLCRDKILTAAYQLYAEQGYHRVSMDRIAQLAGIKKANLFHYYPSKEDLGASVIEMMAQRYNDSLRRIFADINLEPVTVVGMLFDELLITKNCANGCFIGRIGQEINHEDARVLRIIADCLHQWRLDVQQYLEVWRKKGYFRRNFKADELSDAILALYEGGVLMTKIVGNRDPLLHGRHAAVQIIAYWRR